MSENAPNQPNGLSIIKSAQEILTECILLATTPATLHCYILASRTAGQDIFALTSERPEVLVRLETAVGVPLPCLLLRWPKDEELLDWASLKMAVITTCFFTIKNLDDNLRRSTRVVPTRRNAKQQQTIRIEGALEKALISIRDHWAHLENSLALHLGGNSEENEIPRVEIQRLETVLLEGDEPGDIETNSGSQASSDVKEISSGLEAVVETDDTEIQAAVCSALIRHGGIHMNPSREQLGEAAGGILVRARGPFASLRHGGTTDAVGWLAALWAQQWGSSDPLLSFRPVEDGGWNVAAEIRAQDPINHMLLLTDAVVTASDQQEPPSRDQWEILPGCRVLSIGEGPANEAVAAPNSCPSQPEGILMVTTDAMIHMGFPFSVWKAALNQLFGRGRESSSASVSLNKKENESSATKEEQPRRLSVCEASELDEADYYIGVGWRFRHHLENKLQGLRDSILADPNSCDVDSKACDLPACDFSLHGDSNLLVKHAVVLVKNCLYKCTAEQVTQLANEHLVAILMAPPAWTVALPKDCAELAADLLAGAEALGDLVAVTALKEAQDCIGKIESWTW